MSDLPPQVDVSVALVQRDQKILLVHNDNWENFNLPMTKRRSWADPGLSDSVKKENWAQGAMRAFAEWYGRTSTLEPKFVLDIAEFQQSDRDGIWKRYHFQVFKIVLPETETVGIGKCDWLTVAEIGDPNRRLVSDTTRYLMAELQLRKLV